MAEELKTHSLSSEERKDRLEFIDLLEKTNDHARMDSQPFPDFLGKCDLSL